jgi:hypothetical protein
MATTGMRHSGRSRVLSAIIASSLALFTAIGIAFGLAGSGNSPKLEVPLSLDGQYALAIGVYPGTCPQIVSETRPHHPPSRQIRVHRDICPYILYKTPRAEPSLVDLNLPLP